MDCQQDTWSEEYRHACEIRWLANISLQERRNHLQLVESKRGLSSRQRLEKDLIELWKTK